MPTETIVRTCFNGKYAVAVVYIVSLSDDIDINRLTIERAFPIYVPPIVSLESRYTCTHSVHSPNSVCLGKFFKVFLVSGKFL